MRVALTAIIYDTDPEHRKLTALLDSTEERKTDFYVLAVDSKSVAGTEEMLKERFGDRADVFPFTFDDDFAAARNLTLARVPTDVDWWYWADSDDTVEGKTFPEVLAEVPENVNAIGFLYDYERDQFGNNTTTHRRGRLYRNSLKWEWRGAVHEDVYPVDHGSVRPLALKSEDITWVHHTEDRPSSFDRNMKILRKMLEKDPDDARTWYYVGNAFFAQKDFAKSAEAYEKYVGISGWDLERYMALVFQAMAYREMEMLDASLEADTRAMHLMPDLADAYFGIGETYARLKQWKKGLHFGQLGMKAVSEGGIPDADMFINLNAYAFKPYMWMADCYLELGMNERALESLEQAAKQRPEQDLLRGIDHIKWAMSRQRIINNGIDLAAGLIRRNEPLKAKTILENLPAGANVQMYLDLVNKSVAHLWDVTAYSNLYFKEEEQSTPEDALKQIDLLPRYKWALRRLKAAGTKRVLDLGIGDASQAMYFAQNGIEVVGIDVDRRRVKNANFAAVRMGFMGMKTVDFGEGEDDDMKVEVPDMKGPVQFHYCAAEELPQEIIDLGPYDAVVCAELIEHVMNPGQLLDSCERISKRVLLTTPDGAYEGPQGNNPGHVRAWSQREFASLIGPRGRIEEIHRIGYAKDMQQNIVAEYVAGDNLPQDSVIIWCFDTGQGWTPDSIRDGGIGGSETAVIRVAEELVKKGLRVTVYAEAEGVWNGVRYALTQDFRPQACKLFVSWRSLGPTPYMADLAEKRAIWAHDTVFGDASPEQLKGVTVLALSEWHKRYLSERYPGADIVVTGNGIDPERFENDDYDPLVPGDRIKRIPHRLIYAQSPDRGLDVVLRILPRIRDVYPDTTLDCFYGFDMARARNPEFIARIEQAARQPGVTLHGRVGQDRLAEEYLKADALIYPAVMPDGNEFPETYCISVVEAQAAGCAPITSDHGALRETNTFVHARLATFDHDAVFQLLEFWRRPLKEQKQIRERGRKWALQQTWTRIADQWVAMLQEAPVESAAE